MDLKEELILFLTIAGANFGMMLFVIGVIVYLATRNPAILFIMLAVFIAGPLEYLLGKVLDNRLVNAVTNLGFLIALILAILQL